MVKSDDFGRYLAFLAERKNTVENNSSILFLPFFGCGPWTCNDC